jgi:pSer/pThr/pTyr-binding forkhead associated (FHA) protein
MQQSDFERQLGPFVLVQRPPDEMTQQRALMLGTKRTIALKAAPTDTVSLLFELENLLIATLPPLEGDQPLTVGRMPDCEIVVDDPSVSKHHARLSWSEATRQVHVEDLGSSNGTHVNGVQISTIRVVNDGDALSFGDARFCLLLSATLHSRLSSGRFRKR